MMELWMLVLLVAIRMVPISAGTRVQAGTALNGSINDKRTRIWPSVGTTRPLMSLIVVLKVLMVPLVSCSWC